MTTHPVYLKEFLCLKLKLAFWAVLILCEYESRIKYFITVCVFDIVFLLY